MWAQEVNDTGERINLRVRGLNIKNIELGRLGLGHTDPFLKIYKKHHLPTGKRHWQLVYRTEVIKNHLNPLWEGFDLSLADFCDSDVDKSIKIELFDYERGGKHRYMGQVETNTQHLLRSQTERGNGDTAKALKFTEEEYENTYDIGDLIILKAQINQQVALNTQ